MAEATYEYETFPRRELPRHSATITASFRANGKSYVGTIVNMSVTGAMVMGCQPIAPKSFISINIPQVGTIRGNYVRTQFGWAPRVRVEKIAVEKRV